jgi:hypothetical protein
MKQIHRCWSILIDYRLLDQELTSLPMPEFSRVHDPHPMIPQVQACTVRARRLPGVVVAGLIRDVACWISAAPH